MSLSQSALSANLAKLMDPQNGSFAGFPASASAAAANYASAYDMYAQSASDELGNSVSMVSKSGFQSALGSWAPGTTAAQAASLMGNAWAAYWTGGMFGYTAAPPSITGVSNQVVAAVPTPLIASLMSVFGTEYASGATAANALASALHTATGTVILLFTGMTATGSPVMVPGVVS